MSASDWASRMLEARLQGVDLTAQMTEADWAEYRAECRASREAGLSTHEGRAHHQRRLASIERQRQRVLEDEQQAG